MSDFQNSVSNLMTLEEQLENHLATLGDSRTRNMSVYTQFLSLVQEYRCQKASLVAEGSTIPWRMERLLNRCESEIAANNARIIGRDRPLGFRRSAA